MGNNGLLEEVTIYKYFPWLPEIGSADKEMAYLASRGQSLGKAETKLVISCDIKLCDDWSISYDLWMSLYGCLYGNKKWYVDTKDGYYVAAREINKPFKYMLSLICCQF